MSQLPKRSPFARLGNWCVRHRWGVVLGWVVFAVVAGGFLSAIGGPRTASDFTLPDVESRRGFDILSDHFDGAGAGLSGTVVFVAEDGVDDPEVRAEMEAFFAEIEEGHEGVTVVSPYSEQGARQIATQGELAGSVAYAEVQLPSDISFEASQEIGAEIRENAPELDGLTVEVGSETFSVFEEPQAEIVGIAFAIIILIVAFGSVIAMGLPIGVGLAGIGVGSILALLLTHVFEVPDFAQMLGIMIGLGVGIDYALFIVTRFRENRHRGEDIETAVTTAIDTAGRAVAFAGATVVISIMGMVIMRLNFITGLAVSAATIVLVTMVASLTLLPALIGFVGPRIEVSRWRGLIAAGLVSLSLLGVAFAFAPLMLGLPLAIIVLVAGIFFAPLRRELPQRRQKPLTETAAYRWSRVIQHHPWTAALAGAGVLVLLALPVFGLRLGFSDEGNYPEHTDTRRAYDLLAEGFGPGFNGPLMLAVELDNGDTAVLDNVTQALAAHPGIAEAAPPRLNDEASPTAALWQVFPTTSPQDSETASLVHDLRSDVLPDATAGSSLDIAVTGNTAINIDFSDYLSQRLPFFFVAVLALSFLLLMVVFRSVLVPLKAVIMNLLGIGAAYGVIVAGFQWGWFGPILGIAGAPIEPFMPMMLFAIVFGLSMDYEVFLLSRIKEDWDRTGDSHESVANGLAATARVITAAAAIMIVVFSAFALGDNRVIKMAGIGLATAVFIDATLIRMLLVPATMELLGDRNWWLPGWLDRLLPHIDVEGHGADDEDDPSDGAGPDAGRTDPVLEPV